MRSHPAPEGIACHTHSWEIDAPSAAVALIHGYGEHCRRYDTLAARLNREGYAVYSYDQRWHGQSPGKRGQIHSFEALIADVRRFIRDVIEMNRNRPVFVFAHSMGGLVSAHAVIADRPAIRGIVFSSAGVKIADELKPLMQKFSGLIAAVVPWLPVHRIDPNWISSIPDEAQRYAGDPLVYHGPIRARTGHEMLRTIRALQPRLQEIREPILVLHGEDDVLVEPAASRLLFDRAASADKTIRIFPANRHEVLNDTAREEFIGEVLSWMNRRR